MANFAIGLNGISAAQKGMEVVGNNIANASTDGYHRRDVVLTPSYSSQKGDVLLGGGVDIKGVERVIDNLLEQEIFRQQSFLEKMNLEFDTLGSIENALGELYTEDGGLNAAMDKFFNSIQDLSLQPTESVWQNQLITSADSMASQFRTIGSYLTDLENELKLEADNNIQEVNSLIKQIANFNHEIEKMELSGSKANSLRDRRDQCINELSKMINVQTIQRDHGIVDIEAGGISVVVGTSAMELKVGINHDEKFGFTVVGDDHYISDINGGRLGAFFSLVNDHIAGVRDKLDNLATTIIQEVNKIHVQGIGPNGSFNDLIGWTMETENLSEIKPPVESGTFYIRLTNTATGETTRHAVNVDASTDTVSTIAAKIDTISGLNARFESNRLKINADANYQYDFLPGVLDQPTDTSGLTAPAPDITVGGIYDGTQNQTAVCTIMGTGEIGVDSDLKIKVDIGGEIHTVNVGEGYAAGDPIDVGQGITISLDTGTLNDGEQFTIQAIAESDQTGFLAAVGMNTFFSGSSASNIGVCERIKQTPSLIATASSSIAGDNSNIQKMIDLKSTQLDNLNSMEFGDYYRRMINNVGQEIEVRQVQKDTADVMMKNLVNRKGVVSGVDVNSEAAKMMMYEQMFQAMAKYISTLQKSVDTIMGLV